MRRPRIGTHRSWFIGVVVSTMLVPGLAGAVEIGEQAPDFTLPSTMGQSISLRQFRGTKLVLIEFHINDFGMT
jgi:peroxiredoxin